MVTIKIHAVKQVLSKFEYLLAFFEKCPLMDHQWKQWQLENVSIGGVPVGDQRLNIYGQCCNSIELRSIVL